MGEAVDYTRTTALLPPPPGHALAKEDVTLLDRVGVSVAAMDDAVATRVPSGLDAFVQRHALEEEGDRTPCSVAYSCD